MQARIATGGQGAQWLIDGWRMFRAAPLGWFALVFAYWFLITVASLVPFLGVALASALVPVFSVGFMAAARATSHGASIELSLLFDGFRVERRAMALLGVAYFASLALVLGGSALADDGALATWMLTGARPDETVLESGGFLGALVLASLLYLPVMAAFWFAPPLAAWHSTGALKALFFSFVACLINWRPFLVYGAVAALVTLVIPLVLLTVLMFALGDASRLPVAALAFPLLLVVLPTLFASFYASYRDVFGQVSGPAASGEAGEAK
jgi:hypothetical protein